MPFNQWLHVDSILLDYDASELYPSEEEPCNPNELRNRIHTGILKKISDLLNKSNNITNISRLNSELEYNDRRVSGALGYGIAIPHARTLQARTLTLSFLRCVHPGVDYEAPDNEKVVIFFGMVGPSYDDRLYLQLYKKIAEGFLNEGYRLKERLLKAKKKNEIIKILDDVCWHQRLPEHEEWEDQDSTDEEENSASVSRPK